MFTCLNLTPQPASSILSRPVLLWLGCGSGSCCSVSWLPRAGGLPLAPSLRRMLALSRAWASQSSPLVGFIFNSGGAERDWRALRTGGSLVPSSPVAWSIYSAVSFRKYPLVPQPAAFFLLAVVAHKWRPGRLRSSLAISKGMVPLSAPVGTPAVGLVGASPWMHLLHIALFRAGLPQPGFCPSLFRNRVMCPSASEEPERGRSRGEGALLFLSGWTEFAFFRVWDSKYGPSWQPPSSK